MDRDQRFSASSDRRFRGHQILLADGKANERNLLFIQFIGVMWNSLLGVTGSGSVIEARLTQLHVPGSSQL